MAASGKEIYVVEKTISIIESKKTIGSLVIKDNGYSFSGKKGD